ncbi:MAG: glycine cleavage system protein H [Anaerolineaceae bacterium]|nr:glycine cleavage system protein H [Anaerolineaceae bacterium]
MATINGCTVPENLYYFLDKHCWAFPLEDGKIRVGVTAIATKMAGNLTAVTPRSKKVGSEIERGKSIGTMESSKYVGPIPTPVTGTLVTVNEAVKDNPQVMLVDPYDKGWVAEFQVVDWDKQKDELLTGEAAVAAYKVFMDEQGFSCA